MADRHRYWLRIDDSFVDVQVECPYDRDDRDRPCWPYHEAVDDDDNPIMAPDEAPQADCTITDWIDNLGFDEMAHGSIKVELSGAWIDWSNGDYPILQLAPEADQ